MTYSLSQPDTHRLEIIAAILLRCFILIVVALLFVCGVMFVARNAIERLHASMFGLSSHEFNLFLYGFLTLIKCLNVVFFMTPWIAIKLVLKGANAECQEDTNG